METSYSYEIKRIYRLLQGFVPCFAMLLFAAVSQASEGEHRLGQGVTLALGIGTEVTHGDYGNSANATLVTMPVLIVVNPLAELDMTFELPLLFLSSRSNSGVVVTQSGSAGRRRGTGNSTINTTQASTVTSVGSGSSSEAGLGDISLTTGYTVVQDEEMIPKIRPMLYLKVPTGDKNSGLGTGTFEGGAGLSLSKWLGDFQLFTDASYILQNSTSNYQGRSYLSYSAGVGFQATDRLFVSLYAKGSSSTVDGNVAPVEGRLKLNFLQSRRVAWELYGLAGFTNASPAMGGGLLVMYQF